jgi:autotransporter-associated beta strand protein
LNWAGPITSAASGTRTVTFLGSGDHDVASVISDGNASVNVTKTGSGTLTLRGNNSYSGATAVNLGTLLVNGSIGTGAVVVANGTLGGNGAIGGAVTVQSGGTLSPGSGLGTLTVNNNVMLQAGSTLRLEISKAVQANDQLAVTGTLTYGGTLVVANLAGTLAAGDSFRPFQAGAIIGGFSSYSLPSLGLGLGWSTSSLASGLIRVVQTTPTNLTWSVTGSHLSLAWPAGYTGWRLQVQTNSPNPGLGTNWMDVAGSTLTNNLAIPVDASVGSVFYRLAYP